MNDFYDSHMEGFVVPDISRLSQLDRLHLQAKYAEDVERYKRDADQERKRAEAEKANSKEIKQGESNPS